MKPVAHKFLYLLLLMLFTGLASAQENRLALVIGNGDYEDSPLRNPTNDAADMAVALEYLDFEVMLYTDSDRREMGRAIREFGRKLKEDGGVGLFYYAGHGMQIDNSNFLIPVDTPLEEEDEVPYESVDVGSVLAKMESAGNSLNLIILDACRNNPFPTRFRSTSRGLARVEAPIGSLVVYATAPGAVAADGEGRNGVFTGALLQQLRIEGQSLTQTIRRTRAAVVKQTNGQQVPWESSSLLQDYYFSSEPEPEPQLVLPSASESSGLQPSAQPTPQPTPAPTPQETSEPAALATVESQTDRLTQASSPQDSTPEQEEAKKAPVPAPISTAEPAAPAPAPAPEPEPEPEPETATPDNTLALLDNGQEISLPAPVAEAPQNNNDGDRFLEPDTSETNTAPSEAGLSTLTVFVEPADARIRIMDIVEKYKPGMELDNDRTYNLFITLDGYEPYQKDITLDELNTSLNITLTRRSATEPEMVFISGGMFSMGCSPDDGQCEAYEKPTHTVSVAPYAMSATEVTVGQFKEFVSFTGYVTDAEKNAGGNAGCFVYTDNGGISRSNARWGWEKDKNWRDPAYTQNDDYPVTCISWNDAKNYADWLAAETGRAYALPTESQWEMAARAGSSGPWGSSSSARGLCDYANVADRSQSSTGSKWNNRINCYDRHWFSAPVASYQANGFGLFDMQGNTWEWVADIWTDSFSSTPVNGAANNRGASNERVLRGGGWDSEAKRARLSSRRARRIQRGGRL